MLRTTPFVTALALAACASAPAPAPRAAALSPASTAASASLGPASSSPAAPALTGGASASAEPSRPPADARTTRLARLCALWARVRYFHPAVVDGRVDWDAALVAVLPRALDAATDDDAAAAAQAMLDALHDPVTRLERIAPPAAPGARDARWEPSGTDGVLFARVAPAQWSDIEPEGDRLASQIAASKSPLVVIDLRTPARERGYRGQLAVQRAAPRLVRRELTGVAQRLAEHRGYRPQTRATSGGYGSFMTTSMPERYAPSAGFHPQRVAFVAGRAGGIPDVAWAMQRAGDAVIVAQGSLPADESVWAEDVSFGAWVAHVRESEAVGGDPRPDVTLDAGASDEALFAAAIREARASAKRRAPMPEARVAAWRPDAPYDDALLPSRERRLLALFRFWGVIHYFYPYLPLMGEAWNDAFVELWPRFADAATARDYHLAIAALAARIPDGHVGVGGKADLRDVLGRARLPFASRVLEGQVVVTQPGSSASGLAVGDVVTAVGGEPIAARMERARPYVAASNDVTRAQWASRAAMGATSADRVTLTVTGADGRARDVVVPLGERAPATRRTGDVVRRIDAEIGYVDLERLEVADVDAMFTKLADTKAIVFDMRGYPRGTAWSLAPRLNVKRARASSQFFEPLVGPGAAERTFFEQGIDTTDAPLYRGKTVMLVDEGTQSQAEHTGLFLEAAAGTVFIGSQTAGANGDITDLMLPGGVTVSFSGHDVRHADGRQLQRVGLVPDVEVRPTIAGIRAGKDEVLERALVYLRTGK